MSSVLSIRPIVFFAAALALWLNFTSAIAVHAQTVAPPAATAALRQVSTDGLKSLPEPVVVALSGLAVGTQVGRAELQAGADHLVQTGLFTTVNYDFQTHPDGVTITFHLQESPRLPVYFDNLPWVADTKIAVL